MVAYLHSHPVGAGQEDYCITPAQVTQVCSVSKKTTTKPKKTLKSAVLGAENPVHRARHLGPICTHKASRC